ncbi:RimK/LysX family protein [Candidatus Woesearchaeota archaeon]|nr:RimK/LysX family protein [Candidatus Woesearchaeota archaeon]
MPSNKQTIGLTEPVTLKGSKSSVRCLARIDTGAVRSSMDVSLASELGLGPVIYTKLIKSANGSSVRPVVHGQLVLAKRKMEGTFTLTDRSHLRFKVLIGQNILIDNGFLIDPDKKMTVKTEDEK